MADEELHVCTVGDESILNLVPAEIDGRPVRRVPCADGEAVLQSMSDAVPDAVVMHARYADGDGGALEKLLAQYHDLPVIIVDEEPAVDAVVACMRKGAEDFIPIAQADGRLPQALMNAAEKHRLLVQVKQLTDVYKRGGKLGELVGVSPSMHDIYARIKNICSTDATVLIWGESGTGKELVANAIHTFSPRSQGEFVTVNCAAIPKDLLESELFGHEKGSFTSADRQHIGSCERADGGTLFLDEIAEMDMGLQSKMLRFLQNHIFTRVGGTTKIEVDSRVIAATNKDPLHEVEEGRLRDDLYYRLNVVPIYVPPLRERPEDIPVLAHHFLEMMGEKYNKYFVDFAPAAVRLLLCYPWPGNVRELRNTVERIVVLANTDRVTAELLPEPIRQNQLERKLPQLEVEKAIECLQEAMRHPEPVAPEKDEDVLPFTEIEKRAILDAVRKCDGDISKAARKLGLSRATLYRKLNKYGVR